MNPLDDPIVISKIMGFLDNHSLRQCRLVCRSWNINGAQRNLRKRTFLSLQFPPRQQAMLEKLKWLQSSKEQLQRHPYHNMRINVGKFGCQEEIVDMLDIMRGCVSTLILTVDMSVDFLDKIFLRVPSLKTLKVLLNVVQHQSLNVFQNLDGIRLKNVELLEVTANSMENYQTVQATKRLLTTCQNLTTCAFDHFNDEIISTCVNFIVDNILTFAKLRNIDISNLCFHHAEEILEVLANTPNQVQGISLQTLGMIQNLQKLQSFFNKKAKCLTQLKIAVCGNRNNFLFVPEMPSLERLHLTANNSLQIILLNGAGKTFPILKHLVFCPVLNDLSRYKSLDDISFIGQFLTSEPSECDILASVEDFENKCDYEWREFSFYHDYLARIAKIMPNRKSSRTSQMTR